MVVVILEVPLLKNQEEDLCRVNPQLYPSLSKIIYPFEPDSVLITPDVWIMRDNKNYNFFKPDFNLRVSVCSVAAQNLLLEVFDEKIVKKTLINMYQSVKNYIPKTDTLILGA